MNYFIRKFSNINTLILSGGFGGALIGGHLIYKQHQHAVAHGTNKPTVKDTIVLGLCGFVSGAIAIIVSPIIIPAIAITVFGQKYIETTERTQTQTQTEQQKKE